MDDRLLNFEWILEKNRWETVGMNGSGVHIAALIMREIISMPMDSMWANVH